MVGGSNYVQGILVPLDGSKDSFKALAYKEMAQMFSATLFVTTIIDQVATAGVPPVGGIVPSKLSWTFAKRQRMLLMRQKRTSWY